MPSILSKWSLFCFLYAVQCNIGYCSTGNDTLRLNINSSFFSGTYVEIPVILSSSGNVFSVDMAFKFDYNRLIFDDVVNPHSGLQYLYYLNPIDSIWRFTSYHPFGLQAGNPIFYLRFLTLSNEACAYDFSSEEGYINGDSCNIDILGCMDNVGGIENPEGISFTTFPNPFIEQLEIVADHRTSFSICDTKGRVYFEGQGTRTIMTSDWPDGIYLIKSSVSEFYLTRKLLKIK